MSVADLEMVLFPFDELHGLVTGRKALCVVSVCVLSDDLLGLMAGLENVSV